MRKVCAFLLALLGLAGSASAEEAAVTFFIYVKLPESLQPLERGEKYEHPIEALLSAKSLGGVSGGGSSLSNPAPDGTRTIEFCGIDIESTDLSAALQLLREELPRLGIPSGTELHYTIDGAKLQDEYAKSRWKIAQPRTFLHPGFGI